MRVFRGFNPKKLVKERDKQIEDLEKRTDDMEQYIGIK